MSDEDKVEAIRAELPATQRVVYLNNGSAGPLSRQVADLMREQVDTRRCKGASAW